MSDQGLLSRLDAARRKAPQILDDSGWMQKASEYEKSAYDAERRCDMLLREQAVREEAHASQVAALQAEIDTLRQQKAAAETSSAEYKGRLDAMAAGTPVKPSVDYASKFESTSAELTALRTEHAACGPREAAAKRVEEVLRGQVTDLKAQVQAAAKSPSPAAAEHEYDDDPTGCEINVVRGGDDRIRSLVVRYTK